MRTDPLGCPWEPYYPFSKCPSTPTPFMPGDKQQLVPNLFFMLLSNENTPVSVKCTWWNNLWHRRLWNRKLCDVWSIGLMHDNFVKYFSWLQKWLKKNCADSVVSLLYRERSKWIMVSFNRERQTGKKFSNIGFKLVFGVELKLPLLCFSSVCDSLVLTVFLVPVMISIFASWSLRCDDNFFHQDRWGTLTQSESARADLTFFNPSTLRSD